MRACNYLKCVTTGRILLLYKGDEPLKKLPYGSPQDWAIFEPWPDPDLHVAGRPSVFQFRRIGETSQSYIARTGIENFKLAPQITGDSTFRAFNSRKLEFL